MPAETAPLIVSAWFGKNDFAWLDSLRRTHYPADRNLVAAHLTLFSHLPPSIAGELRRRLAELCRALPPAAAAKGLISLGGGTALSIVSPALEEIRAELADAFATVLVPQDRAGWRPHVTIQNKVSPAAARKLQMQLQARLESRPVRIDGLAVWSYRDGRWVPHSRYMFRP